jgi:hypothetical protein
LRVHGFHRQGHFWSGPKVTKRPPTSPLFSPLPQLNFGIGFWERGNKSCQGLYVYCSGPPAIRPGLLVCLHHPWSFDWRFSGGFRWRPPFFVREKRRRFSASMPQMSGRVAWVKKRKESYEGNEGDEGVKMKSIFLLSHWAVFKKEMDCYLKDSGLLVFYVGC